MKTAEQLIAEARVRRVYGTANGAIDWVAVIRAAQADALESIAVLCDLEDEDAGTSACARMARALKPKETP